MENHHEKDEVKYGNLKIAIFITVFVMALEIAGGLFTKSLALLSDGFHMLVHFLALGLAFLALRISRQLPTRERTFGLHRVEIFAAFLNGLILWGLAGVIIWKGVLRINEPVPIQSKELLAIAFVGLAANLLVLLKLKGHRDLNIKGAYLHILGDTLSSIAVIFGAFWIIFTKQYLVDSILSIVIALVIILSSAKLLKDSLHILLEATPRGVKLDQVIKEMMNIKGIIDVHNVHLWVLCSNLNVISAHICVGDIKVKETRKITKELDECLKKFNIKHSTFQFEHSRNHNHKELGEIEH